MICRTARPACSASKPALISSSFRYPLTSLSTGNRPARYKRDIAWNVACRHARADIAALQRPLVRHQGDDIDRERRIGRRQACGDGGSAPSRHRHRAFQRTDRPRHFEHDIAATVRHFPHGSDRILARFHHCGRADLERERELILGKIDGNHLRRAGSDRTQHGCEPDPAKPDHRDRLPGLHIGRVDDRPHSGQHGTAEQRGLVQRQVWVHFHQRPTRHHRMRSEGGYAEMVVHRAVAVMQSNARPEQRTGAVGDRPRCAQCRTALGTGQAVPAARHEHHHDVIADREITDILAQRLDDPGRFVPQRHRQRTGAIAVDHRQIRMAQARRRDPHQDLAFARRVEIDRLDLQGAAVRIGHRRTARTEDCCLDFHRPTLSSSPPPGKRKLSLLYAVLQELHEK